eukprot:TRINITY_DN710_c1_g1_i1.p2 TRINITY_DN710_c1_g1~~TRINITY_DN710_c1_g1_i1.p2  ORF type:complete len:178 (+),score=84.23 TRINITY_DN710_c1_g1_i1:26-535(+)
MGKRKAEGEVEVKKEKKAKKEKKEKKEKTEEEGEETTVRMCVPIAKPITEGTENLTKKVLAIVKYATKNSTMVRGIKEVTKLVRKKKAGSGSLVVLAADISPLDVISHMPLLLEEHQVRYIWVPSRGDLGAAALSKRPTSAVLIKGVPSDNAESFQKVMKVVAKLHKEA